MKRLAWERWVLVFAVIVSPANGIVHPPAALAQSSGDPARGRALYDGRCGGCHSLDVNRTGPRHRGVVGRRVASTNGYDYSSALRQVGGVWTPDRLDTWLQGPQRMAPGSRMYLTVPVASQRRDIIAYLATTGGSGR